MKKTFTKQEVRDLLNKVIMDEVSFTRMVDIMNERVNERVSERVNERVEEIPVRKFKKGDKVKLIKGKKADRVHPTPLFYRDSMDRLIGKKLTVTRYSIENSVITAESGYYFAEDWLEPYEELKKGDLAIFWEEKKKYATIRIYDQSTINESEGYLRHKDNIGSNWKNAIKFESKEQYERLIKGEI